MTDRGPGLGLGSWGLCTTFSSPFSLLIYHPQRLLVDPFPLSVCSQSTPKTVLQQYICFMISWGANEEKQGLPVTAPVPVNVQRAGQPPLVWSTGGKAEGSSVTSSMWMFHFPPTSSQAGTSQGAAGRGRWWSLLHVYTCVSLTHAGQMGPT